MYLSPINLDSTNIAIAGVHSKPLTEGMPLGKSVTGLSPDSNTAISIAPVSVDEVLKTLLFFRQLANEDSKDIYRHLGSTINFLRWLAPDVKTILDELAKITPAEQTVAGVKLSTGAISKYEEIRRKGLSPKAQHIFNTVQSLIKFFEQMKTLFPSMTEEDFEKTVFKTNSNDTSKDRKEISSGLKEVVEALAELNPVTISTEKKNPVQRTKEVMKPIISNQASRVVLSHFVDLLEAHGKEQNSPPAIEFAKSLRSSLKLTDQEEEIWRKLSTNKDSDDERVNHIRTGLSQSRLSRQYFK